MDDEPQSPPQSESPPQGPGIAAETETHGGYVESMLRMFERQIDEKEKVLHKRIDDQTGVLHKRIDDQTSALREKIDDKTETVGAKIDGLGTRLSEKIEVLPETIGKSRRAELANLETRFADQRRKDQLMIVMWVVGIGLGGTGLILAVLRMLLAAPTP